MKFERVQPLTPNARILLSELVTVEAMAVTGRTAAARELASRGLAILSPSGRKVSASKAGRWAFGQERRA